MSGILILFCGVILGVCIADVMDDIEWTRREHRAPDPESEMP